MKKKQHLPKGSAELLFTTIASVIIIILNALLISKTNVSPLLSSLFFAVILIAAAASFFVIKRNAVNKKKRTPLPETVSILANAMVDLPHPAFVCIGEHENIIWSNKAAAALFGSRNCKFEDIFNTLKPEDNEGIRICAKDVPDKRFAPIIYAYEGSDGREYKVIITQDTTDYDNESKLLKGKEAMVAYISVDNLEELVNSEQEAYRSASGDAEKILRQWAVENGGVLKEYQQDKYIFICELATLHKFIKNEFDILNQIRNIRVGKHNIPVTISMGVSTVGATLSEREKAAQAALETALQRGGDQVFLKTDIPGVDANYGGRTKSTQKRSNVRARAVANELVSHISSSSNVIIMGHAFADYDALGSCVGLARLSKFCGVPVNIVRDPRNSSIKKALDWMSEEEEYRSVFIDSDSAMDLITSDTLLIVADVNNKGNFESKVLFDHCERVVIIDHHRKADEFQKEPLLSYIEPSASSASELVAEMLELALPAGELLPIEANLMMSGILLDTNQFTKNTGTRTFSACLFLRGVGVNVEEVQELFKSDLDELRAEMKFYDSAEIHHGVVAISATNTPCTFEDKVPAAKAANRLLTVEGVKASFVLIQIGNDIHISARSVGTINVQLILQEIKGGGHFDSAGARINNTTMESAVKMLDSILKAALEKDNKNTPTEEGDKENEGNASQRR